MKRMHEKGLSLRRSCALIGFERSSLYYRARPRDDSELIEKLKVIAKRFKRFGYRRAHALIVRSGEIVASTSISEPSLHRLVSRPPQALPRPTVAHRAR